MNVKETQEIKAKSKKELMMKLNTPKSKKELMKIRELLRNTPSSPQWVKLGECIAEDLKFRIAHSRSPLLGNKYATRRHSTRKN
jgi:hypothetical protein